jgi:hypothetical protein
MTRSVVNHGADYVIAGAGSAGCVLARRLAQTGASVILLEAGGPDRTRLVRQPGMIAIFHNVPALKKRLDWGYYTAPQSSPAEGGQAARADHHAHADLPEEPRHPPAGLGRPGRRTGHRPRLPDRTRRQPPAARRDRADPRDDGQPAHRGPGQPGAEPGIRLPRPGCTSRRAAEPRDLGVPRGGHLPDGHGRAGGGGSGAAGPRPRRAPGRRRVDHARNHRREHERPRDDDRRALCQPYGATVIATR